MLRRQKWEISRENEEKSVKTDNFVQIEKFPSKNGRFRRLNIPPWYWEGPGLKSCRLQLNFHLEKGYGRDSMAVH